MEIKTKTREKPEQLFLQEKQVNYLRYLCRCTTELSQLRKTSPLPPEGAERRRCSGAAGAVRPERRERSTRRYQLTSI